MNLGSLNANQKQAVISNSQYIRIIAGAGSGKTRVLSTRIAYLINERGVYPNKILAITFTNKAANEMKSRVSKALGSDKSGVWISTIHSLCVRILREDINTLGYPRNFTILDSNDQKTLLKEAYNELNIAKSEISHFQMLEYIANNKAASITTDRADLLAGSDYFEKQKAQCYKYYLKRQQQMFALDFDDLLLYTVKIFDKFPEVLSKWNKRFSYIHVDEFQDIDKIQYRLILMLASSNNSICVVGDPDQTIYTWRGADVNIIMGFEKDFVNVETIILNENYRSSKNILNGANSLIKNNKHRVEKDLYTNINCNAKIIHYSSASEEYESYWVINKIKELVSQDSKYNDFAVLYRSNYLSRGIEKVMMENQVPYVIYGGTRFYDRQEVKDCLAYLRLINQGDDLAFLRIINNPKRGFGKKSIDKLFACAKEDNTTMYETLKNKQIFTGKLKQVANDFVNMVEIWKTNYKELPLNKLLDYVLEDSGYLKMLKMAEETDRIENIKELINDIKTFMDTYYESSLDEYLQLVALYGDKEDTKQMDCVKLMTIHASKGLEFDKVFVVGLSEGVFPSTKSMEAGIKGIEEERRLAYVAFTRAKRNLFLTDSGGYSYILNRNKTTSRFVKEIIDECIEHQGLIEQDDHDDYAFAYHLKNTTVNDTKTVEPEKLKLNNKVGKKNILKKGDKVMHAIFKNGVVVSVNNNVATIAFEHPFGIKKIQAQHPSIKKVG